MRYCGRQFDEREIEWIRDLIAWQSGASPPGAFDCVFAKQWNWRKPDGGLKDMSCRVALSEDAPPGADPSAGPQASSSTKHTSTPSIAG